MRFVGATIFTSAPNMFNKKIFDLATLECKMSPQIAIRKPSIFFFFSIIVSASSKACVGCSRLPSPAFKTEQFTFCERRFDAPLS